MTAYSFRRHPMLLVVSSPSGGGKTTIVRALLKSDPELAYSVSSTTRKPRPDETDGRDYDFLTREAFRRLIDAGQFFEWAEVYGNLYGTRRDRIEQILAQGRDVALDIDVQGAMSVRRRMPDAVLVFLVPPSMEVLEQRLRGRGQNDEQEIARRLREARDEIAASDRFDYRILNDRLDDAIATVRAVIAAERARSSRRRLVDDREAPPHGAAAPFAASIIHVSPAMRELLERAQRVAFAPSPVLLLGESGTGKEILAEAIHQAGPRARGPLVRVNCGAIPPTLLESELFGHEAGAFTGAVRDHAGLFRAADGGTIFLDEIGELPLDLQVKLLRVLQDGEVTPVGSTQAQHVDVRALAATNRDLAARVRQGAFREDLYYRLNVVALRLPPLRERRDDIPVLVNHFLQRLVQAGQPLKCVDPDAMAVLMAFDWPGNVRQLENAIEHAVVLGEGDRIGPDDLPDSIGRASAAPAAAIPAIEAEKLRDVEIASIRRALEQANYNLTHAARRLGITRRSLTYRLDKYGIQAPRRRGRPRKT